MFVKKILNANIDYEKTDAVLVEGSYYVSRLIRAFQSVERIHFWTWKKCFYFDLLTLSNESGIIAANFSSTSVCTNTHSLENRSDFMWQDQIFKCLKFFLYLSK